MEAKNPTPAPLDDVSARISAIYPELPVAMQKFADFILEEPFEASRMSIHAAVSNVGVSVATAHRFVIRIGYAGYGEFRDALFESFRKDYSASDNIRDAGNRFEAADDIFRAELLGVATNVQTNLQRLSSGQIEAAVDRILAANRIFVIGTHNSSYLAAMFAAGLEQFGLNSSSSAGSLGAVASARQLYRYTDKDLVIAIAFPRYYRDTVELARLVSERGVPVLAITDGPASPLNPIADLTFHLAAKRVSVGMVSDAAILALIEALVAAVAFRIPNAAELEIAYSKFAMPWYERS